MGKDDRKHVEFVSYDGKFPNLCRGTLVLRIDGEEVSFDFLSGNDFWASGGNVSFTDDWEDIVTTGEWELRMERIPDKYRKYADEMINVFNANVDFGCCGGCV